MKMLKLTTSSPEMICSVAWEKITYNSLIYATKIKLNMATTLGIWGSMEETPCWQFVPANFSN